MSLAWRHTSPLIRQANIIWLDIRASTARNHSLFGGNTDIARFGKRFVLKEIVAQREGNMNTNHIALIAVTWLFMYSQSVVALEPTAADEATADDRVLHIITVPDRTGKHREFLDSFGYEILSDAIEELAKRGQYIYSQDLIKHFGKPAIKSFEPSPFLDPDPGIPNAETIVWEYPGMLLKVSAYPPVPEHLPQRVYVERVEISSPAYKLKHGLRIGQPYQVYINLLGPPNEQTLDKIEYRVDDRWMDKDENEIDYVSYQIVMAMDEKGIVRKITWTWESD